MGHWSPPLRIARRTTRRSLGRTLLVAALIGLPVMAATFVGVIEKTSSPSGEALATVTIGQANARLDVTQYGKIEAQPASQQVYSEGPPAQGFESPVRTPATFDPSSLLPPGTTLARQFIEAGTVTIHGATANTSVGLITGDGNSPLTKGSVKLDQGRFGTNRKEIAISPKLAHELGITGPSGTVTATDGKTYAVVGIARAVQRQGAGLIFATPDTDLLPADPTSTVRYVVGLPASADVGALATQLLGHGLQLVPRATIVDPPSDGYTSSGDPRGYAVMTLLTGFGILEVVLLAGTAFAVGARRQTRELGLITATGGTPTDVRRIVLLQGAFAGVVGALGGLAVAFAAVLVGRPLWERLTDTVITSWQVPWVAIVLITLLGLGAGLAAAVVPAIGAGRQTPMAALAGRFTTTTKIARVHLVSVILLVGGVFCAVVGSGMIAAALKTAQQDTPDAPGYQSTVTPEGPIALVLIGITATIAALVWMLPSVIAKLGAVARLLPLNARMALRDAARHRHRTGPATAAIMMAVAGTAAIAFAASNSIAASAKEYIPAAHDGDAVLTFRSGYEVMQTQYSPGLVDSVAAALPVKQRWELGSISLPNAKINQYGELPVLYTNAPTADSSTTTVDTVLAVDPDFVARFGDWGKKAAAELRTGRVLVTASSMVVNGQVAVSNHVQGAGAYNAKLPARFVDGMPSVRFLQQNVLISTQAARKLGTIRPTEVHFALTREPTKAELAAVARVTGDENAVKVENGYQSPAQAFVIGILTAATVVTLLGVAISVSLSAAEGRADLATLAAIGAPPRRRRSLAAAQAWVLGQLGCVLGVGVGALYGYTAHAAFGSPHFEIPWIEIGGIVLAVPLFAGLLAWLLTRSRLPMVARID
ncbi:FtsX-like permease family protein [Kribbella sp. NPDC026611]|uniref:FtsX-like permease family protein n=1 Tax=Kribbella sp. NPDC026611 TaxID=3154911 RepID=UPI003410301F